MIDVERLPLDVYEVRRVLRQHAVAFALVFGSWARGEATSGSDVDVAVWGREPLDLWALAGALPSSLDLLDLRTAPEGLTGRVALTGVLVLDDDPAARVRWQADTRKRHLDEEPRRRQFGRDFVAAHG